MQGGQWRLEREIGRGAFGVVSAWTNQVTHERLVIKQVNSQTKLDSKSLKDWLKEITLMNTMTHDNIVSGKEVPEEIKKIINNPVDLLGLEICDCDLRKVLTQPMNCCGLKEKNVLNILRDLSCGVKFLHEDMKITHRDLKPENILLKHSGNETVYKITDLGYAKRIDPQSICMSFVGTLQYLAPELYEHTSGYTYTADYWSFGTVIFECITGERPFLLTEKPFEWFKLIKGKKDEQIWGYFDENVGTKFCTELPAPNLLCVPLLSAFKDWLQLVLRQDHHKRGENIVTGASECFVGADNILQLKIIHIFDMLSCKEAAYDSQYGRVCLDLKLFLEQQLNLPKDDQLFFAASGSILEDNHSLVNEDLFKDTIYLFSKNKSAKYSITMAIPEKVREIITSPEELHSHAWLKTTYTHCVFYCQNSVYKYMCLLRGLRALMISMKSGIKSMRCLKEDLNRETVKLETMIELYVTVYNSDITYMRQSGNSNFEAYEKEWDPMLKEVQSFSKPDLNINEINSIEKKFSALEESLKTQKSDTELDRLVDEAGKLYTTFRTSDPHKKYNAKSISVIVRDCRIRSESLFHKSSEHLKNMMKCYNEIGSFNKSMEKQMSTLQKKYKLVMGHQISRQRSLLRKLSSTDSHMPSVQTDLLVGLQCAFKKADNGSSGAEFTPGVITNISDNFSKLKKLTRDEHASTESVAPITITPMTPITTSSDNDRSWQSLNSSMSSINIGQRRRAASSPMHPLPSLSEDNNSSTHFRFNERRDAARQVINISPSIAQPEHHISSPRPVVNMHENYPQMMMMMHPYNDVPSLTPTYDTLRSQPAHQFNSISSIRHPSQSAHQFNSINSIRHPTSQTSNISYSNSPRAQGRYVAHAARDSEDVSGNRHPFGGSSYEPGPGLASSYNLRMQHFSNAPLSLNQSSGYNVDTNQYNQRQPMNNNPQVYHRGYFVPVYENVDMISL